MVLLLVTSIPRLIYASRCVVFAIVVKRPPFIVNVVSSIGYAINVDILLKFQIIGVVRSTLPFLSTRKTSLCGLPLVSGLLRLKRIVVLSVAMISEGC